MIKLASEQNNQNGQNDSLSQGVGQGIKAGANAIGKGVKIGKKALKIGKKVAGVAAKKWLIIGGVVILGFLVVLAPLIAFYNSAVSFFLPVIRLFDSNSYDGKFYNQSQGMEDLQKGYIDLGDELADDFAEFWAGTKGKYKIDKYGMKDYEEVPDVEYVMPDGEPADIVKGMMQMFAVREMYYMCHPDIWPIQRMKESWAASQFKDTYGESLLDFSCKKKVKRLSELFDDYMHIKKGKKYKVTQYNGNPDDPNTPTQDITYRKIYVTIESDEQYLADHPFDDEEEEAYYKQFSDKAVQSISKWDDIYLEGVYYGFKSTDNYSGGGIFGYVAPNLTKGKYKIEGNGWNNIVKIIMPEILRAYAEHPNAKMLPSVCLGQYFIESGHHNYSFDGGSDGANGFGIDIDGKKNPGDLGRFEEYANWHDLINAYYDFFEYTSMPTKKTARKQKNPYVQIYWIEEGNYCASSTHKEYRTKVSQVIYDLGLSRFDKCLPENGGMSPEEAVKLPIDYDEKPPATASVDINMYAGIVDETACARNQLLATLALNSDKESMDDLIEEGMSSESRKHAWCTYYVTHLIRKAKAYPDLSKEARITGRAETLHQAFKSSAVYCYHQVLKGAKPVKGYKSYTPRAGDIIFFAGIDSVTDSPVPGVCHHTGIVVSYDSGTNMITYANGNCSDDRKSHVFKIAYKPNPDGSFSSNSIMALGTTNDFIRPDDDGKSEDKDKNTGNLVDDFNNSHGKKDTGSGDTLIPGAKKKN